MAIYGYHRTSTAEQHLDRGVTAIREYCEKNNLNLTEIFTDQQTGKNFDRPDYQILKRMAKNPEDIIILSELDRLGRNKAGRTHEPIFCKISPLNSVKSCCQITLIGICICHNYKT